MMSSDLDLSARHPAVQSIATWFDAAHLPVHLRPVSQQCANLASSMITSCNDGPELTAGLRKLLEAKDCFVRAAIDSQPA
jgi:hypothetical protein